MGNSVDELCPVSALLDNELEEAEAREVQKKIGNSGRWKDQYEELKALGTLLKLWDRIDSQGVRASASFELRLFTRLRDLRNRQSSSLIVFLQR